MAEIVNLRQARKHKARTEKERVAQQNRAQHGRSKAERERDRLFADKAEKFVAGHRREAAQDQDVGSIGATSAPLLADKSDA